ncbi:MAG: membrane dipeptidase [Planctomycetes bacterium]|nr:membrane dipeptidase [Planctomycetota bacterium]
MFKKLFTMVLLVLFVAATVEAATQRGNRGNRGDQRGQRRGQRMTEEQILEIAKAVHEKAITLDTHVDISGNYATETNDPGDENNTRLKCSLPKMEKGGLDGVFLAVFVGQGSLDEAGYERAHQSAMNKFEGIHRLTKEMYPERCALALTADDVEKIAKTGKRVILIGIENGYPIGTDIKNVEKFYNLGARYITLCHSGNNQIAESSGGRGRGAQASGISEFGAQVVAEMNRLGIMCDVSHIADKSFDDLIKLSKAPIIASHSGCRALSSAGRNLTDDQLKALAKNGGVIQMVALGSYLRPDAAAREAALVQMNFTELSDEDIAKLDDREKQRYQRRKQMIDRRYPATANLQAYVNHLDHAVQVAGIDHVGIGTDFDGGGGIPGFNDHSDCLNVTVELVRRGYTEEQIIKIWGGNLLRVMREVEKVAKEIKAQDK